MTDRRLNLVAEPGKPTFVITRVVDAPPQLVFDAWTKPELLARWWTCETFPLSVCEVDLREGGGWRFVQRGAAGDEHGFKGVYREIAAPERLVYTFIFEPMPEHEALVTMTLEEQNGKTMLTETTLHKSVESRDGHLASGVEGGANESYARLDKLLGSMI